MLDTEKIKLLDFIVEHDLGIRYALEHKDRTMLEDILSKYFELKKTVYAVKKVIGQLEEKMNKELLAAKEYESICSWDMAEIYSEKAGIYRDAIKIVKTNLID